MNGFSPSSRIRSEKENTISKKEEHDMKKLFVGTVLTVVLFTMGAVSAFAAGPGRGRNYVAANENGICDYAEEEDYYCADESCPWYGTEHYHGRGRQSHSDDRHQYCSGTQDRVRQGGGCHGNGRCRR